MSESLEFIKNRAVQSIAAATEIAGTWVWDELPVAGYQDKVTGIVGDHTVIPAVPGQEEKTADAEQVMLESRGLWDGGLDQMHRWTMQALGMGRTRFRDDPVKSKQMAGLSARGTSRSEILREALEWESAWEKMDPTWAPLPANTLAAFKTLRQSCVEGLQNDYADARAAWREEAEKLNQLARELEDINVAWYADATRVFLEGTPEGDMIRGTVPTTYTPPAPTVPPVPPGP